MELWQEDLRREKKGEGRCQEETKGTDKSKSLKFRPGKLKEGIYQVKKLRRTLDYVFLGGSGDRGQNHVRFPLAVRWRPTPRKLYENSWERPCEVRDMGKKWGRLVRDASGKWKAARLAMELSAPRKKRS